MTNIMAKFMWCIARVDSRQYRQNSTELAPESFWLGVEIPLTSEYVWNAEEILAAQLGSGNVDVPKPIYKNKAIEFCQDYFGEYLRDPEPDDFKAEKDPEDWSETDEDKAKQKAHDILFGDDNNTSGLSTIEDVTDWGNQDDDGDPEDKDEMFDDEEETWS